MAINQLRVAEDGLHPCNPRLRVIAKGPKRQKKWLLRVYEEIEN